MQNLYFCNWLISFDIVSSGFIHVVPCVEIFFVFKAGKYSLACICHILCIYSPNDGHLGGFHLSAVEKGCYNYGHANIFYFYLFIFCHPYGMQKFQCHNGDNAESLTCWTTRELLQTSVWDLFSFLLGFYPEVELLDHMVILCLIVWDTTILFSTVAAPFHFHVEVLSVLPQYQARGVLTSTEWQVG